MPWYNIIWNKLVVLLLPIVLRKPIQIGFLSALVEPIRLLHNDFLIFRTQQLYEAEINGQVINLERVLNDTFDPTLRRIYISDGDYFTPPIFFEEYKDLPVIFNEEGNNDNPIFYSEENLENRVAFNFYVNVPTDVWFSRTRVRALVNKYRAFGRIYDIKIIE